MARSYEIRIEGDLSPDWSDWFGGMRITGQRDGQTVLAGEVADQAALHGLLSLLRDLNLTLISVNPSPAERPQIERGT